MARTKPPQKDDSGRWLATYGDAVTLLLAFFIMLYAISQVDVQKFQLLVSGFEDPFKNEAAIEGLLDKGNGLLGAAVKDEATEGLSSLDILPTSPSIGGIDEGPQVGSDPGDSGEYDGGNNLLESDEDLIEVRDALADVLTAFGVETSVGLQIDSRGLVVSIATDEVLFPSGSPVLQQEGRDLIAVIAPILNEFDNEVKVEGHTDTVPLNQNGYTNWNLSADRALAVLTLLENEHDLNPRRLSATGYGEHRPIATNANEDGRQLNRRVELVIVAGTPPAPADE
jgi:chemotaxis protein MotB